jgi:hypothetical protein
MHPEANMIRHASPIFRWSTVRWIEIFFILGLPVALTSGIG